jgi:S-methylmethionine-dependent homocysteine/selenocysteine methylase
MSEITLLDGSIGQELVKRAGGRPTPLWSTTVMMEKPELVAGLHRDYFAAGASVATTNSYAVLRDRLARAGIEDQFEGLLEAAVAGAVAARDAYGQGKVAGSLGPLQASYRPDLCPDPADAARAYGEIEKLMGDRVDLLLIETVVSVKHAQGALQGVRDAGKPVWLAVSTEDHDGTRLRSGEALADLASVISAHAPDAVLVNCTRPEVVGEALEIVRDFGLPFGAYANGFTRITQGFLKDAPTVDALEGRSDLGPADYADFVMGWVGQGATIVGGCCEITPAHIAEIATRLDAAGHQIV